MFCKVGGTISVGFSEVAAQASRRPDAQLASASQTRRKQMVAFILFLILAWVVVGIIGFVVHRCSRHGVVHP